MYQCRCICKCISLSVLCIVVCAWFCIACSNQYSIVATDWFVEYLDLKEIWNKTTGKGVTVAVIDSGVDYKLLGDGFDKSRVLAEYNAIDGTDNVGDSIFHGTAMVSIIGAAGSNGLYGVAPACNFIVIKVLDSSGSTNAEILCRAIEFAISAHVDIINLSVGGGLEDENLVACIKDAVVADIALICAVGDYNRCGAIFPAYLDECIGVAAIDDKGYRYTYSNYGEGVDAFFPGVNINTLKYGYSSDIVTVKRSGSSIATAVASGMVALYMSYMDQLSLSSIYEVFKSVEAKNIKSIFMEDK